MRQIALGIVVTALISTSAWAEEPAGTRLNLDGALAGVSFATAAAAQDDEAEERPVSVSVGVDVPSDYYWRGYAQEGEMGFSKGFVAQPFVDLGVALSDVASLNVGIWTSMHTDDATSGFYEADYYAALGFAAGKWSPGVAYTAYASPNDSFSTIHELALSIGYDDSDGAGLSPSALIGFFSDDAGTYFEAGIEPAIPTEGSVSLSVPVAIGLSVSDFYEETFGFFKVGLAAGADLGGGLEAHAGFDLLFLGDSVKFDDKSVKPVVSVGFSYTY